MFSVGHLETAFLHVRVEVEYIYTSPNPANGEIVPGGLLVVVVVVSSGEVCSYKSSCCIYSVSVSTLGYVSIIQFSMYLPFITEYYSPLMFHQKAV